MAGRRACCSIDRPWIGGAHLGLAMASGGPQEEERQGEGRMEAWDPKNPEEIVKKRRDKWTVNLWAWQCRACGMRRLYECMELGIG